MAIGTLTNFMDGHYLSVVLNIALIGGVLAGNHGVRKFLLFLAWIGLIISGVALAMIMSAEFQQGMVLGVYSVAVSGFTVWTLSHKDVREWMFKTAFKDGL